MIGLVSPGIADQRPDGACEFIAEGEERYGSFEKEQNSLNIFVSTKLHFFGA
jgi:hypothetical protein